MTRENKVNLCNELKKLFGYNKVYNFYKAHIECDRVFEKEVIKICAQYGANVRNEYYKFNAVLENEKIVLYCFDIVNY